MPPIWCMWQINQASGIGAFVVRPIRTLTVSARLYIIKVPKVHVKFCRAFWSPLWYQYRKSIIIIIVIAIVIVVVVVVIVIVIDIVVVIIIIIIIIISISISISISVSIIISIPKDTPYYILTAELLSVVDSLEKVLAVL